MNHIVLFEPEIPQNTGNIMRTCVATASRLHLIKPLGFSLTDRQLKRSGLDYLDHLDVRVYEDLEHFYRETVGEYFYFTRRNGCVPSSFDLVSHEKDTYLVFGSESAGLPKDVLKKNAERCLKIPTTHHVRSLNLSNAVAIGIYELLRQQGYAAITR